ncbi:putative transcription factor/ chromatin remodeling BED-type(Zn) family [Arabidopsis thaliana]|jgi:hypothetical protein|nr:BED zinc finger and hAT dimerization domain-containing protein [Arabidopsis thaliana]AEE29729.1 BED zinc finger and hAT dimerization domain-containing protein [Arabidopsis thaliana]KAG7646771.1 Ribonuclease H-like superfamily [Arabidopsis thaliana x Arabidopsis arenosa]OAP12688.1 hypothetical protein AXX17_AT1G19480 [Arabidopsis thaliana]|eukprot:NP_001319034.1 BED zinc finger and hAT dimerization domain-containing protein [Arabidopsis thaliana]
MEWNVNNAFKTYKEMEPKAMMDMTLVPHSDPIDIGLGSSDKSNSVPPKRKKTMTSVYLKYFETAPDSKTRKCKFCGQSYSIATATGNLGRHLTNRHPGYDKAAADVVTSSSVPQTPPAVVKPSQSQSKVPQLDYDHLNWLVLKWLALSSLPPSTVDETWLGNSFKFLKPSIQLWPAEKYKAILDEVFTSMRGDVKTTLEHIQSKVSVTLSFWNSYENIFYMSVTGQWIDENWSSHRLLLDICRIPYPSGGSEIYNSLLKVLKTYAIEDRILCCTHDNSENAIHACHSLKEYFDGQKVLPFCYIPCAAQTLNDIIDEGLATIKPIISKVREFTQELNASTELSDDFIQLTTAYQEGNWKLPIDASSRWSGNYQMVNILCKASKSLDSVIRKNEDALENRMMLSSVEKNAVTIVHNYLDLDSFHKTTNDMCTNKDLTVGLALLFMDNISEMITTCQKSCHNPDWLRTCAESMAQKARSYNTQVCNVFTYITAILDPRIKTEYIPETINLESYIDEARSHFIRNYSSSHFTSSMTSGYRPQEVDEGGGNISFAEEIARRKRRGSMSNNVVDELTQYLSESIVPMQTDVLDWWKVNSGRYPRLSNMARDFLAVQATSAAPEEIFCGKGEEIDKQKYCMPHDSTQSVICIRSWIEAGMKLKYKCSEIDYERLMELAATVAADNSAGGLEKIQQHR